MQNQPYRQMILETIEALLELQLKSVRRLRGKEEEAGVSTRRKVRKRQSLVDLSVEILTKEQRPVHTDELVELLKQSGTTASRIAIRSPAPWLRKTAWVSSSVGLRRASSSLATIKPKEEPMQEIEKILETMVISRVDHLPIVAAFCRRAGLVATINRIVPTQMDVDVGTIVLAMVLDTLSGRSPLYRLADFFKHQDTELLLGRPLANTVFNDTSVGRAMDAIFEVGAEKLFSEVAFQACLRFPLDMSKLHFDTTSVNLEGKL